MCHDLRVLLSISAFSTHERQTLVLFVIVFITIGKQAKEKKSLSSQSKFAFHLAQLGVRFPFGMKTALQVCT